MAKTLDGICMLRGSFVLMVGGDIITIAYAAVVIRWCDPRTVVNSR